MKFSATLLALAAAGWPATCSAHYFFPHFIHGDDFTEFFEYVRENTNNFVPQKNIYNSNDFRCNQGSLDFAKTTGVYKVKAGDTIGFGTDFGATIQHPGPLQVYLSQAPGDVRDYDGSGDWVKIYELGPTSFDDQGAHWGVTGLTNLTFTLPKETPAGQYLVRIEHIAVHGALTFGGAELYFNCAQIDVESDSTAVLSPSVKIPGVYTGSEPGILFDMYSPVTTNYTMPGPEVWPGLPGSSSPSPVASSSDLPTGATSSVSTFATVTQTTKSLPIVTISPPKYPYSNSSISSIESSTSTTVSLPVHAVSPVVETVKPPTTTTVNAQVTVTHYVCPTMAKPEVVTVTKYSHGHRH